MATYHAKKALEILREEGPIELSKQAKDFLQFGPFYDPMRWAKYGRVRPRRREILHVDPKKIEYGCGSSNYPDDIPPYGVIEGDWDLKKTHWTNRRAYSLYERYKGGKQWEETEYYQAGIERLESGGELKGLDGPQTIPYFENYLDELDSLYEDIKSSGYNEDNPITVSIGRDGEWMVNQGNHRHAMLQSLDIEQVPVRIKYRHKQWQEFRMKVYNDGLPEGHENLRDHPDLQDILD